MLMRGVPAGTPGRGASHVSGHGTRLMRGREGVGGWGRMMCSMLICTRDVARLLPFKRRNGQGPRPLFAKPLCDEFMASQSEDTSLEQAFLHDLRLVRDAVLSYGALAFKCVISRGGGKRRNGKEPARKHKHKV